MFLKPSSTADLVDEAEGELELDQLSDQAIGLSIFLREKLADVGEEDLAVKKFRRELELVAAEAGKHSGEERRRLLRWAVSIQVRLGNLYLGIDRPEEAAEQLMKAAETSKMEKWGVVKDKVVWSGTEVVVSSLEQLGNYYAKHEKYSEAFDAYCEAVSLVPPISCERVSLCIPTPPHPPSTSMYTDGCSEPHGKIMLTTTHPSQGRAEKAGGGNHTANGGDRNRQRDKGPGREYRH